MNEETKKALEEIEGQLYAINARNISLRWIAMKNIPTIEEVSTLNALIGFIVHEIRVLRETGSLDVEKEKEKVFGKI